MLVSISKIESKRLCNCFGVGGGSTRTPCKIKLFAKIETLDLSGTNLVREKHQLIRTD